VELALFALKNLVDINYLLDLVNILIRLITYFKEVYRCGLGLFVIRLPLNVWDILFAEQLLPTRVAYCYQILAVEDNDNGILRAMGGESLWM
jgi:hypothetical protein